MIGPREAAGRTFRSLRNRNYRLYFAGQFVSMTGTWMQSVAQAWLVLRMSHSGFALGLTVALQFLPVLLGGAWGGLIADRVDKRRLVILTQVAAGGLAAVLGVLTVSGWVQLWMVYVLALLLGVVNMVDMPARQSFVFEMVGREDLSNAVSLNSVLVNAARVVGPAVAGLLIASVGVGICFLVNAASYVAVIAGLMAMDRRSLRRPDPVPRERGQIRAGLRHAWSTPNLRVPLVLVAVVGTLVYNFSVVLPLLASVTFGAGPEGFGVLFALMGAGAVLGGLAVAGSGRTTRSFLLAATLSLGAFVAVGAIAPTLAAVMVVMVPIGAASTAFIATANSMLQLNAAPEMRGRVMALFSVVFLGTTPLGSPVVGWVADHYGPRASLLLGGVATVGVALATMGVLRVRARTAASGRRPSRAAEDGPTASVAEGLGMEVVAVASGRSVVPPPGPA